MCDTMCCRVDGGMLFAKNSDRPVAEAQVVESHPSRPPGPELKTQYLTLPDAGAAAVVGSRPTWLWGFEHGVNEHGVAAGNEKLYTIDDPKAAPPALLGMDLVRLGLERSRTADEACDVITALVERHGQGGSGEADHDEPYFSSFLAVDARGGWVIETSGRTWAARPVGDGTSISNRISLSTDWTRASNDVAPGTDFDRWRAPNVPTGIADHRLAATRAYVGRTGLHNAATAAAVLRDHGRDEAPPTDVYDDWSGVSVCMHVRDYQATTASMIAELRDDGRQRMWIALGSPCVSVFVPAFPPFVAPELADAREWARFARLRDRAERDPATYSEVREVLGVVEHDLWAGADDVWRHGTPDAAGFAETAYRPVHEALKRLGV